VLVGQGDPTIIMVLNGKLSFIELEQIWLLKKNNFLATMSCVASHKWANYSGTTNNSHLFTTLYPLNSF
jgi:hypothetical protein